MCNFLSGITKQNGDMIINPFIDSHDELEQIYNLKDGERQYYVKWELTPSNTIFDIKDYKFRIDEDREPDWLDIDFKERIEKQAREYLSRLYKKDLKDIILLNEVAILENCTVKWTKFSLIKAMKDSQVNKMWGNSQVNEMWENSQVNKMWENSQVNEMWGNSQANVNNSKNKLPK